MSSGQGLDDTEAIGQLMRMLRAGCTVKEACRVARVGTTSFYRWISEGQAIVADIPPEERSQYHGKVLAFVEGVELAAAQNLTALELRLHQRAMDDGNVPAIIALLKRNESGSWHGNSKVEISGPEGGPVIVHAVPAQPDMSDPGTAQAIWQARADMGDEQAIKLLAALND